MKELFFLEEDDDNNSNNNIFIEIIQTIYNIHDYYIKDIIKFMFIEVIIINSFKLMK